MTNMKNVILIIIFSFFTLPVFAKATTASRYAESQYAEQQGFNKVRINVKNEHTDEYQQKIGTQIIPAITYGYGDMKIKGCKKSRISYIVLLDCHCEPIWSYIMPSK